MSEPAPASPAAETAPTPPAAPTAPTSPTGPSDAERKARTKLKAAGLVMLILGGFFLSQGVIALAMGSDYSTTPGGIVAVRAPDWAGANVTLTYAQGNATVAQLDAAGSANLTATFASFTLRATVGDRTFQRDGLVVSPGISFTKLGEDQDFIGYPASLLTNLYATVTAIAAVIFAGGFAAFRRSAYNLAMVGAVVYLASGAWIAYFTLNLFGLMVFATAAMCLWFIYRNRAHSSPGWAFWRKAA